MTTNVRLEWLRPELDRCRALIAEHKSPKRWTKTKQGRSELVTEVDLAIEQLLIDAIRQRLPDAAILSEESNADPSALEQDTCFVIDPIDGTEEFAAGRPGFGISIALFEGGRPAAAVLDMPAHDWRFEGAVGAGASLNGKGIRLSRAGALAVARLAVSATQYGMASLRPFWDGVGAAALVPTPAFTPKFAAVLAGECEAALYLPIRPHRTAIWDYAAAAQLLSEAGGWFGSTDGTDLLEALPFEYSDGWVAASPSLRDQLLAVAQRSQVGRSAREPEVRW
jgi:myo-inositol-1(or 4)-monophosphatase